MLEPIQEFDSEENVPESLEQVDRMNNLLLRTQEGKNLFLIPNSAKIIWSDSMVLGSCYVNEIDKEKE